VKVVSHVDVTLKVCVLAGCVCVCVCMEKINNCWSRNMQGMENLVTVVGVTIHSSACNA